MTYNVFVLGLDEIGSDELAALPDADRYNFHQLLTIEELQDGTISVSNLVQQAQQQLEAFDGSIDAIVGYWDFPVSMMVPILSYRYGLASKPLEAVVKCEHKYWSRLEQEKVIDAYPGFDLIDVHDPSATLPDHMSYPAWVKPIKSFSSEGAHRVTNDEELQAALAKERGSPERLGGAFDEILEMLDLPDEIDEIPGGAYMVEEAAKGKQFTVEGFTSGDKIHIIGIIDSLNYEHAPSFLGYRYPSTMEDDVLTQMTDATRRVIDAVGLTDSTFNVEFFWDEDARRLNLLEINSRHSQAHAQMFHAVDGLTNHAAMVDLALGQEPHMPSGEGQYAAAGNWFLRHFSDGRVHRVPTDEEIEALKQQYPGTHIKIAAEENTMLSDADAEDSYSFTLAEIFTAGDDAQHIRQIYDDVAQALHFEIEDVPEGA